MFIASSYKSDSAPSEPHVAACTHIPLLTERTLILYTVCYKHFAPPERR